MVTSDQGRRYSEEEFALILSRVASSAELPNDEMRPSAGFSLEEMKAIAAEAGIDPLLVERVARATPVVSGESRLVRVLGGPAKYELDALIDTKMTRSGAEYALRSVQAAAVHPGKGEASSSGMSWYSPGFTQVFVNAHSEGQRSRVRITVDRRPAAVITGVLGVTGSIVGLVIIENSMPIGGAAAYTILATSLGSTLAIARISWAGATRRFRAKATALMDAVAQTLIEVARESTSSDTEDGSRAEGA